MVIELGKWYETRGSKYRVRIISLIGNWSKKHPLIGELYEIQGKRLTPIEGGFEMYEHWCKDGKYLSSGVESSLDLVREYCEDLFTTKI